MLRESLPLLIALLLPLAGAAGYSPARGTAAGPTLPLAVSASSARIATGHVVLPAAADLPPVAPVPVAGVWLNF